MSQVSCQRNCDHEQNHPIAPTETFSRLSQSQELPRHHIESVAKAGYAPHWMQSAGTNSSTPARTSATLVVQKNRHQCGLDNPKGISRHMWPRSFQVASSLDPGFPPGSLALRHWPIRNGDMAARHSVYSDSLELAKRTREQNHRRQNVYLPDDRGRQRQPIGKSPRV